MTSAGDDARGRWLALAVLCASLLVIVVDNTIVNVALPTLARDLRADVSELQWVVDAYTRVFAGLLLLAGALGDRFGRRLTLLCGLAVFGGASAWAAYAGGVDELILPLAALALVAGRRVIPESRDPVARRIDWTGAGLSGAGLVALVWAVIEAPSKGWTSAPVLGACRTAAAIAPQAARPTPC